MDQPLCVAFSVLTKDQVLKPMAAPSVLRIKEIDWPLEFSQDNYDLGSLLLCNPPNLSHFQTIVQESDLTVQLLRRELMHQGELFYIPVIRYSFAHSPSMDSRVCGELALTKIIKYSNFGDYISCEYEEPFPNLNLIDSFSQSATALEIRRLIGKVQVKKYPLIDHGMCFGLKIKFSYSPKLSHAYAIQPPCSYNEFKDDGDALTVLSIYISAEKYHYHSTRPGIALIIPDDN